MYTYTHFTIEFIYKYKVLTMCWEGTDLHYITKLESSS